MDTASAIVGDLVKSVATWNPERDGQDRFFLYVDLSAVDQDTKAIVGVREIPCSEAPSRARQIVQKGDVLVSTVRPNLNAVALVDARLDGATASTGFCVLRPCLDKLDVGYLFHWVRSPRFIDEMVRRATGASYPAVSDRIICESKLPLPQISEQRRIAHILDRADAMRAKRRAALAQLDELTPSVFLDMFGDPAVNPRRWHSKRLGNLARKFSDGPFGSNLKSEHYVDHGIRVVRLQNIGVGRFIDADAAYISEQHFAALKKHECVPGDVLVGTMGDPNLRACIQPDSLPVALNKADCVQIRADKKIATPAYICALLNQPSVERMAQALMHGQTRVRVSMGRLRELQVPVPPIELQEEFARRASAVEQMKSKSKESLEALDALFASLQHRAFRSEL